MFHMSREDEELAELDPATIYPDEARRIVLRVIEQAKRDFLNYQNPQTMWEQEYLTTASGFLFDDSYRIEWGEWDCSLQDLLDIFDRDVYGLRKQVLEELKEKLEGLTCHQD